MFLKEEERPAGEPVKVGTLKLSEAIRIGKPIVGEEAINFTLCALGCAWAGVHGRKITYDDFRNLGEAYPRLSWADRIGRALGFDQDTCERVSTLHSNGMPALQIADRLEARGL